MLFTSKSRFCSIEIMRDSKYLLPDNQETIRATEILAKEGLNKIAARWPTKDMA